MPEHLRTADSDCPCRRSSRHPTRDRPNCDPHPILRRPAHCSAPRPHNHHQPQGPPTDEGLPQLGHQGRRERRICPAKHNHLGTGGLLLDVLQVRNYVLRQRGGNGRVHFQPVLRNERKHANLPGCGPRPTGHRRVQIQRPVKLVWQGQQRRYPR